jgi:hypothetical protein
MSQELGQIERPTAESFAGTRKIFLVPLVYSPPDPPADYVGMLERYWAGVRNQIRRLSERTGPIARIYHEGVFESGETGVKMIEQVNPRSHALIAEYVQADAKVESLEDSELFAESVDWQRCLMVGLMSRKVIDLALNSYREATRQRFDIMAKRINDTLMPAESAILLIQEDHSIQFPKDIQVFYVAPPALDEIHRWLREQDERARRKAEQSTPENPAKTSN